MAYFSLLNIIDGRRTHGLTENDPEAAMPQIEGILEIAQKYDAIHKVKAAFDSLLIKYVQNRTLWRAIAKAPVRCLKISIALKSRIICDEAFKDVVGESASLNHGCPGPGLPEAVLANRCTES